MSNLFLTLPRHTNCWNALEISTLKVTPILSTIPATRLLQQIVSLVAKWCSNSKRQFPVSQISKTESRLKEERLPRHRKQKGIKSLLTGDIFDVRRLQDTPGGSSRSCRIAAVGPSVLTKVGYKSSSASSSSVCWNWSSNLVEHNCTCTSFKQICTRLPSGYCFNEALVVPQLLRCCFLCKPRCRWNCLLLCPYSKPG